jgi:hypothetical protein
MATRALLIQWGLPHVGRERMALEEWSSYMQWTNQLMGQGKIERFGVYGPISGNQQRFSGFTLLEGTEKQIDEIADSEDFRLRIDRCMTSIQNFRVERCDAGGAMAERMKLYGKSLGQLGL